MSNTELPRPAGDWRDTDYALTQVSSELKRPPETMCDGLVTRTVASPDWKLVEEFLKHYPPLHLACHTCKTDTHWLGYRCADCNLVFCSEHIRPHFEESIRASQAAKDSTRPG